MMRGKTSRKIVQILVIIFVIGTVFAYIEAYTPSYSSLEQAVKKSSNGGKIAARYDFDKGSFIFIKGSNKKYGYYFVEDKKWYHKGFIYVNEYNIEGKYKVTVYYVQRRKLSFIKVESEKELENLNDSLNTSFQELKISRKNKFFFGGTYKQLPSDYNIIINDKEYLLKEYNNLFRLFQ
ncbi:MAG: hypothetical protein J6X28_03915 [Bacilli bacterium]|nr:hypothetical protein [Bacilli bacterium]